jgi:hypothetical protein
VDGGADGSEPKIVGQIGQLAAGSMGLVIPVSLDQTQAAALSALTLGNHQAVEGLFKIAAQIFDQFPAHLRSSLLPSAPTDGLPLDPRSWTVNHMVRQLIMVSPLISGSWPPSFGQSTRADLQDLEGYGGFSSLRLRDLKEKDLEDEQLIYLIRTLLQILSDRSFPIWSFYILEDVFTPVVQELVRYCPPLLHLRSHTFYGSFRQNDRVVLIDGQLNGIDRQIIDRTIQNRNMIMNDPTWYDAPRSFSMNERIAIRNMSQRVPASMAEIVGRPDLSSAPMIMDGDWKRSLQAFIVRMSKVHDPGHYPLASVIRHILDQHYDSHSGEFAAGAEGIRSPLIYSSFQRPGA